MIFHSFFCKITSKYRRIGEAPVDIGFPLQSPLRLRPLPDQVFRVHLLTMRALFHAPYFRPFLGPLFCIFCVFLFSASEPLPNALGELFWSRFRAPRWSQNRSQGPILGPKQFWGPLGHQWQAPPN